MRFNRIRMYLLALPFVTACATTLGSTSHELLNARETYARAASSPAVSHAPGTLAQARLHLTEAERANREDPLSDRERRHAYLAARRAELAIAQAQRMEAEREAVMARVALERNAAEVARAAEQAKAEADAAARQAQLATEQARVATQQVQSEAQARATAEQELARLEQELADTRSQLAARGDTIDAQTRALEDREAALQAQVEQLRVSRDLAQQELQKLQQERDDMTESVRDFATVDDDDRGMVITVPSQVMFRTGSARLLPHAKEKLDQLAVALGKLSEDQKFVVEGHTDSRGTVAFNRSLSKRRANAVRAYLIDQGVEPDRIIARGKGEGEPIASNREPEGRLNNRRVEIVVSPSVIGTR